MPVGPGKASQRKCPLNWSRGISFILQHPTSIFQTKFNVTSTVKPSFILPPPPPNMEPLSPLLHACTLSILTHLHIKCTKKWRFLTSLSVFCITSTQPGVWNTAKIITIADTYDGLTVYRRSSEYYIYINWLNLLATLWGCWDTEKFRDLPKIGQYQDLDPGSLAPEPLLLTMM